MLDRIAIDSMLQLEWLTAMHFHKMINDYRNSKNYKSIHWDNKLWMAARNHNVYLLRNNGFLSHSESEGNSFYTGKRPQDRVNFVTYFSNEFELAGFENCNFSGFEISIDKIDKAIIRDVSVEKMNNLAVKTAKKGFEIWRKSAGHNKNMLNPQHIAHGTSFVYGKEGVYGTSVFANYQKYYEADSLLIPSIFEIIETDSLKVKTEYSITSPFKKKQASSIANNFITSVYSSNKRKLS